MFITVDTPVANSAVDPWCFEVLGWLWLAERHADFAAVEVWANEMVIGETDRLFARPDVVSLLGLPDGTLCGFQAIARCGGLRIHAAFEIRLRVRFHDGSRSEPLVALRLETCPVEASPLAALHAALPRGARGLEIGAHSQPVPGLTPFYTDNVAAFAGARGRADFLSSALALPIPDATLDYLCSSHVIEHLADPIAALLEWHRVLRPGGYLYLVAPDKRFTFDEPRRVTPVDHFLGDFLATSTFPRDVAHVREFIYETDWDRLKPGAGGAAKADHQAAAHAFFMRELERGGSLDIHFHTFTPQSFETLLRATGFLGGASARFDLVARAERYPADRRDGMGFLLRKRGDVATARDAVETFHLAHADPAVSPLPLVCPATLQPLGPARHDGGTDVLATRDQRHRYATSEGLWALLAPADSRPSRPWANPARRLLHYVTARTRMALSAANQTASP